MTDQTSDTGEQTLNRRKDSLSIEETILGFNENLEEKTITNANHAFNLGCMLGLIPAGIIILLSFILTKGSWLSAAIITVLMVIGLMLVANLAAQIAKNRTMERVYTEEIEPDLKNLMKSNELSPEKLYRIADDVLLAGAPLREYIHREISNSDIEEVER